MKILRDCCFWKAFIANKEVSESRFLHGKVQVDEQLEFLSKIRKQPGKERAAAVSGILKAAIYVCLFHFGLSLRYSIVPLSLQSGLF